MRAEEGQDMEIGEVQEKKKVKYRLAGSIGVKLLAFWLLIISGIIFCGAFGIVLVNSNMDITRILRVIRKQYWMLYMESR